MNAGVPQNKFNQSQTYEPSQQGDKVCTPEAKEARTLSEDRTISPGKNPRSSNFKSLMECNSGGPGGL
jgi:hypothetical protein